MRGWRSSRSLLRRRVPSASRPHAEILAVVGDDFNRAVVAVRLEIGWLVGNSVLAAQLILNLGESIGHVANLEREKRAAASGIGNALENLVARTFGPTHVRADGVNDGLGALRHFDGLFARHVAQVVVAVAEQNNGTPDRRGLGSLEQFVAAGKIKGIIKRRAASRTQLAHSLSEHLSLVGEVLRDFGCRVKAHHKRLIVTRTHGLIQKFNRRLLLELEAVANRVASIYEKPDLQRQVRLGVETANFLRRLVVVDHVKIALLQIGDAPPVLVGYGEHYVHFVSLGPDGCNWLVTSATVIGWIGSGA